MYTQKEFFTIYILGFVVTFITMLALNKLKSYKKKNTIATAFVFAAFSWWALAAVLIDALIQKKQLN